MLDSPVPCLHSPHPSSLQTANPAGLGLTLETVMYWQRVFLREVGEDSGLLWLVMYVSIKHFKI